MKLVIGMDSGGTKTVFAACDEKANVVVFQRSQSIAPTPSTDWVSRFDALLARHEDVVAQAEFAVFGLAFHGEDAAYSRNQLTVVQQRFGGRASVENDVRIAFDGALAGRSGVLVLAGTGSMAWGSSNGPRDAHFRVGGWGQEIGDEGSAFWIGRQALQSVSRHLDGRDDTPEFCAAILASISITSENLHRWIYDTEDQRRAFAALAVTVSKLAVDGNVAAQNILRRAADYLAEQVLAVWRQIGTDQPLVWSYAGGVFNSSFLLAELRERLQIHPMQPRLPPIGGALLRAAKAAGWAPDDAWIEDLSMSLQRASEPV